MSIIAPSKVGEQLPQGGTSCLLSLKALRARAKPAQSLLSAVQQDLGIKPGVLEAVGSTGPFLRDILHHGQQEGTELCSLLQGPLVLLHEHFI